MNHVHKDLSVEAAENEVVDSLSLDGTNVVHVAAFVTKRYIRQVQSLGHQFRC